MVKVHTIDLRFRGCGMAIASYLVEAGRSLALIEPGPASTLGALEGGLKEIGFYPEDIEHVFVTHVHLDHGGAAWWWAEKGATVYVHEKGARHLIDPARLKDSAQMVYGEAMDSLWGEVRPCAAERVTAMGDDDAADLGEFKVSAWDTPGHARHHMTFVIEDIAFTGDVTGVRLPGCKFISVTGAPPQFDPVAYDASLVRLGLADFSAIYPTHFGRVDDVTDHIGRYQSVVGETCDWVREQLEDGCSGSELRMNYEEYVNERAKGEGVSDAMRRVYEVANPSSMSADGIAHYWRKKKEKGG